MTNHISHFSAEDIEGYRSDFRDLAHAFAKDLRVQNVEADALAERMLRIMQEFNVANIVILGSIIATLVESTGLTAIEEAKANENPRPEEEIADASRD